MAEDSEFEESQKSYRDLMDGKLVEESSDPVVFEVQKLFRPFPYYRHDGKFVGRQGEMMLVETETMCKMATMLDIAKREIGPEVTAILGKYTNEKFMVKTEPVKAEVKSESNFQNDLGADSLDTVELVMALEEAFDIEIPDEAAEGIATVGDAIKYIQDKQA